MNRNRLRFWRRVGPLIPALMVCRQVACLPDDALRQVFGENIVLTFAIGIQTVTSQIFNSLFGFI